MGVPWFIGDIHAGHKNIANFRKEITSEEHNREVIGESWNKLVTKRDLVWVLGDAAFTQDGLDWIGTLKGEKRLLRGNHDTLPIQKYLEVFSEVYGILKYKNYWLSHAPIHPDELRGKSNIHGHVHYHNIRQCGDFGCSKDDGRYLNTSVENVRRTTGECLFSLNQVREYFKE